MGVLIMDYIALSNLLFGLSIFSSETCLIALSIFLSKKIITNNNIKTDYINRFKNYVIDKPESIQREYGINLEAFSNSKYEKEILAFCKLITERYPAEYIINFYNNINSLIVLKDKKIASRGMDGVYLPISNRIKLNDDSEIYHELFHMASTMLSTDGQEDVIFCGFRQQTINTENVDIGVALNEGYTELMTHRYFGQNHLALACYKNEINVARIIEKVIETPNMEKLYLSANLPGLISLLEKYLTKDEIIDFITRLDIISKYSDNSYVDKNKIIEENVYIVWNFLLKIYTIKLKEDLAKKRISEEDFINTSLRHINFLKKIVTVGCHKYYPEKLDPAINSWERILNNNKLKKLVK